MFRKMCAAFMREGKIWAAALAVGLLFTIGLGAYTYVYSHGVQRDIANSVLRFHVQAHSNSAADQALKDYVRDRVLAAFEPVLHGGNNIEATREALQKNLADIEAYAAQVVYRAGYAYPVTVGMTQVFFPTQFYGNLAFPPGKYEAVQVVIGDGAGSNWWCLMFPPLCYVDMTATDSGRRQLEETVPAEGLRLLMHQEEPSRGLTVRFRVVEWWQNRGRPAAPVTEPGQYVVTR